MSDFYLHEGNRYIKNQKGLKIALAINVLLRWAFMPILNMNITARYYCRARFVAIAGVMLAARCASRWYLI
jgi:hypothetical protein